MNNFSLAVLEGRQGEELLRPLIVYEEAKVNRDNIDSKSVGKRIQGPQAHFIQKKVCRETEQT